MVIDFFLEGNLWIIKPKFGLRLKKKKIYGI